MIKLLHLADLHLDRRFTGTEPSVSAQKREELRATVKNAFKYASQEGCRAVIISGDLFDSEYYTSTTLEFLVNCFASMPQISFIIAPGNHDPYNFTSPYRFTKFPENVFIFKNEHICSYSLPDLPIAFYGYAFTSPALRSDPLSELMPLDPTLCNILCAHTELNTPMSPYAPIFSKDIARLGFKYAALGHIHTSSEMICEDNTLIAYSGCIAGADFTEYGEKGGILLTVDEENGGYSVNASRVRFCPWVYETVNISASDTADTADLAQKIRSALSVYGTDIERDFVLRVTVTGQTVFETDMPLLKEMLADITYLQEIKNESITQADIYSLSQDFSIRGEFYRTLLPLLESDDTQTRAKAHLALQYGLCALSGNDINVRGTGERG